MIPPKKIEMIKEKDEEFETFGDVNEISVDSKV